MPKWNGEKCKARRVVIRVGKADKPTYWYAHLEGQEIRAVEVDYRGEKFLIADEDGNGWHKVSVEGGGPHWGHKSIAGEVIRERTPADLDHNDCYH
jgi:hypothetical protein